MRPNYSVLCFVLVKTYFRVSETEKKILFLLISESNSFIEK